MKSRILLILTVLFCQSAPGFFVPEEITFTEEKDGVYRSNIVPGSSDEPVAVQEHKEEREPKSVSPEALKPRRGALGLGGFRVLE